MDRLPWLAFELRDGQVKVGPVAELEKIIRDCSRDALARYVEYDDVSVEVGDFL